MSYVPEDVDDEEVNDVDFQSWENLFAFHIQEFLSSPEILHTFYFRHGDPSETSYQGGESVIIVPVSSDDPEHLTFINEKLSAIDLANKIQWEIHGLEVPIQVVLHKSRLSDFKRFYKGQLLQSRVAIKNGRAKFTISLTPVGANFLPEVQEELATAARDFGLYTKFSEFQCEVTGQKKQSAWGPTPETIPTINSNYVSSDESDSPRKRHVRKQPAILAPASPSICRKSPPSTLFRTKGGSRFFTSEVRAIKSIRNFLESPASLVLRIPLEVDNCWQQDEVTSAIRKSKLPRNVMASLQRDPVIVENSGINGYVLYFELKKIRNEDVNAEEGGLSQQHQLYQSATQYSELMVTDVLPAGWSVKFSEESRSLVYLNHLDRKAYTNKAPFGLCLSNAAKANDNLESREYLEITKELGASATVVPPGVTQLSNSSLYMDHVQRTATSNVPISLLNFSNPVTKLIVTPGTMSVSQWAAVLVGCVKSVFPREAEKLISCPFYALWTKSEVADPSPELTCVNLEAFGYPSTSAKWFSRLTSSDAEATAFLSKYDLRVGDSQMIFTLADSATSTLFQFLRPSIGKRATLIVDGLYIDKTCILLTVREVLLQGANSSLSCLASPFIVCACNSNADSYLSFLAPLIEYLQSETAPMRDCCLTEYRKQIHKRALRTGIALQGFQFFSFTKPLQLSGKVSGL